MCVVSMIGTEFTRTAPYTHPGFFPAPGVYQQPTRAEFDALALEVAELKKLLLAAKAYDAATGQPDCEADEKVALIKRLAELVGVDLSEVFDVDIDTGPR